MQVAAIAALSTLLLFVAPVAPRWPAPQAPAIPSADGFVVIPNAAVPPAPARTYRAIYNATQGSAKPDQLLPAVNMAGSELNAMKVAGVPAKNVKFVLVFHDVAMDGILDDKHYRARFGVANPNLPVLAAMRKAGVELFVCGQNVAFAGIDPATLTPDVRVASDALIVLMQYQNDGYALLSY